MRRRDRCAILVVRQQTRQEFFKCVNPLQVRICKAAFAAAPFPLYKCGFRNGPELSRARRFCAAKRTLDGEDRSGTLISRERGRQESYAPQSATDRCGLVGASIALIGG